MKRVLVNSSLRATQRWLQLQYWPGVEGWWRLSKEINSDFPLGSKIIISSECVSEVAHISHTHTQRVFCNGQNVKPTEKCCKSNSAYGPRDPEILNYSVPSVRNLYDAPISHFDVLINFTGVSLVHKKQQQLLLLANAIELVTGKQSGGKTSECLLRKGKAPQGEFKCE